MGSRFQKNVLLILVIFLFVDLFFLKLLPGSNASAFRTPPNIIILSILFLLFLWRSGYIVSKTHTFITDINTLDNVKNKKRVNTLFYTWYFFVLVIFIVWNFFPRDDPLFYHKYKIYFQVFGFIVLLFVIYMMKKSFEKTREFKESMRKRKNLE